VGLGNPGVRYRKTRHNIGFQVVDCLAQKRKISTLTKRFRSQFGTGWIDSEQVALIKPITYMNLSGEAVAKAAGFFRLKVEDLLVIHDDLDLPFGRLRFKQRGGDGGHQGIRSIIDRMGGDNFLRLKVGIGRPPDGVDPADYVLTPFSNSERNALEEVVNLAAESIETALLEGVEAAMNRFQKKSKTESV
jgi:peptidyl-tRNA hydrolase, PTH1 family